MTAKGERPMSQVHPLKLFRAMEDLTLPEAAEFFSLSAGTIRHIEAGTMKTPEWLAEWLDDPMMDEEEIKRRVQVAKATARRGIRRRSNMSNPVTQWRKRHGLSQRQAADHFGVHWATVSSWELGDSPIPERIIAEIEKEQNNES